MNKILQLYFYSLLIVATGYYNGYAQTQPNKSSKTPPPPPPPAIQVNFGIDGDYRTGNIDRKLFKTRFSLNYEPPQSIVGFNTNPRFSYGTFKGLLNEREMFLDWNTTFFASQRKLYYLIFGIAEQSNLRKISSRFLGGIGVGYRILGDKNKKSRYKLSVTNAIIYETTDFFKKQDIEVIRNSTRIKFSGEVIANTLYINSNSFIQPALNTNNFRWNTLTQVQIKMIKGLFMSGVFDMSYESVVPEGAKNTDMAFSFGINYIGEIALRAKQKPQRDPHWWMR